jgi:hypothetical protein
MLTKPMFYSRMLCAVAAAPGYGLHKTLAAMAYNVLGLIQWPAKHPRPVRLDTWNRPNQSQPNRKFRPLDKPDVMHSGNVGTGYEQ